MSDREMVREPMTVVCALGLVLTMGRIAEAGPGTTRGAAPVRAQPARDPRGGLAADIGFLFRAHCDECNAANVSGSAYVWILRGGIDLYPRAARTPGLGIHSVFWFGKQGSLTDETAVSAIEISPPTMFIEVALLGRNGALFW